MGRHAKSFNVIIDTAIAYLTLVIAFLSVSWRVSTGKHAWQPLPEVDSGATVEFAAVLAGWNEDPPTVQFPAIAWPTEDPDLVAVTA